MHIHILGICGTIMGGVALLARRPDTGDLQTATPTPMSTQLEAEASNCTRVTMPDS
jgi:UDP-N-acetylmuramate-alanine ligase